MCVIYVVYVGILSTPTSQELCGTKHDLILIQYKKMILVVYFKSVLSATFSEKKITASRKATILTIIVHWICIVNSRLSEISSVLKYPEREQSPFESKFNVNTKENRDHLQTDPLPNNSITLTKGLWFPLNNI